MAEPGWEVSGNSTVCLCEQITGEQARNFAWGIRLLPGAKRRALSAVYAMARRIDDIGDGQLSDEHKLAEFTAARRAATDPKTRTTRCRWPRRRGYRAAHSARRLR